MKTLESFQVEEVMCAAGLMDQSLIHSTGYSVSSQGQSLKSLLEGGRCGLVSALLRDANVFPQYFRR